MKKLLPLILITIFLAAFRPVQSTVTKSAITFQTKNMGIGVTGRIGGLKANATFNPANLTGSTIETSVDANTINTDNSSRDDHLKGAGFFDVAHYPRIIMKSVSFRRRSANNYVGAFNLTIKGKTKLVQVPFTFTQKGTVMTFKGRFRLNRLDFGIGDDSLVLSNDVTVNIETEITD